MKQADSRHLTPDGNVNNADRSDDQDQKLGFLAGGGEMGGRVRAHDWTSTSLGAPEAWPQSLKTVLSACLNSPLLGAVLWGPDLLFLYNDAYVPSLADRHPGALGRPVREVWGDAWEQVAEPFYQAMRTGEGFSTTTVPITMTRNGVEEFTYWDFTAAPIRDEEGRVAGLLNQGVEVTERLRAEKLLHELNRTLEERVGEALAERKVFSDVVETSTASILALDLDYNILAINRANVDILERVYGKRPKPGDNLLELLADMPQHQTQVRETWRRALAGEEFVAVDTFGDEAHERTVFEVRFNSLRDENGHLIGASHTAHDVSDRARAQEELEAAQSALRQSQKMEAVGQLTGGLAHDFNNLLAGMMGNLELLQMRIARGRLDDLDRFINAAQGAGRRAATLTQRLLAFSRRQTLDPKPTDVNRLLVGLHDLLHRTVGATVDVEIVQAAGLWPTHIDGPQLENAIINLCVNGRDAMPDGGKLTIETANKWMDDRTGRERDLPPGQYVSICVTDTGTGMSAETIRRAFEPFFTTKPLGEGTGLGLSMIYGFARQSGGEVRIYSEVGQGTTVCIYLPRHHGDAQTDQDDLAATLTESTNGQTVLVVDDEATIRHVIDEVLDDLGYTVIGAADGAAGIKVLQSGARIDLLITDVGLPNGMNGRQVADEARRLRPGLKVMFITGFAENAAVGNGHLEPGMELLTKPFTLEALSTKVANMLKASTYS